MMFDPILLIMLLTLSLSPRTIDEIPITTVTPITMPSTVRPERSLLLRMVPRAIWIISPNSLLPTCIKWIVPLQFEPQGRDRIEGCRLSRGIHSKEYAYTGGDDQTSRHRPKLDYRWHPHCERNTLRHRNTKQHAQDAAH